MPLSVDVLIGGVNDSNGIGITGSSGTDLEYAPSCSNGLAAEEEWDATETETSDTPEGFLLSEANSPNEEQLKKVCTPGTHDVLLGRGGGTNNYIGNIKFRKLVNEHKMRYLACNKVDKPKVARQVVALWRKLDPPGRFLAREDESRRGPGSIKSQDNVWFEVGDKKAREKASQCLRERTPDVIPYIKHLRDQQNAITEQGVGFVQMQMQQQEHFLQQQQQQQVNMVTSHPMMAHSPPYAPAPMFDQHSHTMAQCQNPHNPMNNNCNAAIFRRNSMPAHPQPFNAADRQCSLPSMSMQQQGMFNPQGISMNVMNGGDIGSQGACFSGMSGCEPSDVSEAEYQHQMMMIQQNMMHQQMQMQRLQQSRMQCMGNNAPQSTMGADIIHQQQFHQQPCAIESNPGVALPRNPNESDHSSKRNESSDHTLRHAPDRAISLMSLTPANPDDHELSLEDYRQQLEEYIANTHKEDNKKRGNCDEDNERHDNEDNVHDKKAYLHNDDGQESDLEDDWEKERERAIQRSATKARGVPRNMSGVSCLSLKSNGMSLVSGFSGVSDMMSASPSPKTSDRDKKMDMARSACSNLSLLSELTDLSQNIDNLSIYDD